MKLGKIYFWGLFGAVFLFLSCGEKTPNKEFTEAKQYIEWAKEVKADRYSNENLVKAKQFLYKAHETFIINEKYDDAVKLSKESVKFSKKAIEESLPLFAKEEIEKAEKEVEVAKRLYADSFDKEDFDLAISYLNRANEDYKNKRYYSFEGEEFAYRKAKKSYDLLLKSEMVAKQEIPKLQQRIQSIEDILKESAKYNIVEYDKERYEKANAVLNKAKDLLKSEDIRNAVLSMDEAEKMAKELLILAKQKTAEKKIKEADEVYNKAKNMKYAMEFKEELLSAEEALKSSKTEYGKKNYEAAIDLAEECISRSNAVILMAKKREEEQKVEKKPVKVAKNKEKVKRKAEKKVAIAVPKVPSPVKELSIEEKLRKLDMEYANTIHKKVKTYRVVRRRRNTDCLWRIASYKKIYNDARLWPLIYSANQDKIKDPDLIFPGQILVIPPLPDFFKERVEAILKEVRKPKNQKK
jgi:nucleoid-associated protein YgaU